MKIYTELVKLIYDLFLIPVFLIHFLGIPFLIGLILKNFFYLLDLGENLSKGIAILVFFGFFAWRVWRAFDWETKHNMPKWIRWFSQDLKNKIVKK